MLKHYLAQKLSQKALPQQIQQMKLMELPVLSFEQRLIKELEDNAALEIRDTSNEDSSDNQDKTTDSIGEHLNCNTENYQTRTTNYGTDYQDKIIPYASGVSFREQLLNQLSTTDINKQTYAIAEFLIGSLDSNGYILRPLSEIAEDLGFLQKIYPSDVQLETALSVIHQLDPAGIGARNLRECLLLQLKRKTPSPTMQLAIDIISDAFDAFSKKHHSQLIDKFNTSETQLKAAINSITGLNPKPAAGYFGNTVITEYITPDFTISITENYLELTLNSRNVPELHISEAYQTMLKTYKETGKKTQQHRQTVKFITHKLQTAQCFIDAIIQRQQTLFATMNTIMNYQSAYFLSGDDDLLEPMQLKDIASKIGMDVSTISRVVNSKYVETPYGTKLLKGFFSKSITNDRGKKVSIRKVKNILKSVIIEEDKNAPLTDVELATILKEKGYSIARRRITTYREQLKLPVARLRKRL